jgi:hypothetical protein
VAALYCSGTPPLYCLAWWRLGAAGLSSDDRELFEEDWCRLAAAAGSSGPALKRPAVTL